MLETNCGRDYRGVKSALGDRIRSGTSPIVRSRTDPACGIRAAQRSRKRPGIATLARATAFTAFTALLGARA